MSENTGFIIKRTNFLGHCSALLWINNMVDSNWSKFKTVTISPLTSFVKVLISIDYFNGEGRRLANNCWKSGCKHKCLRSTLHATSKTGIFGHIRLISGYHTDLACSNERGLAIEKQRRTTSDLKLFDTTVFF